MKYAIPFVALVVIAAATRLYPDRRGAPVPAKVRAEKPAPIPEGPATLVRRENRSVPPVASLEAMEMKTPVAVSAALSWRKLAVMLQQGVSLTSVQQAPVEAVLRDREEEVQALHEGMRRSGVVVIADYEWQVIQLRMTWFRKIDGLLDSAQHERFVALVEKGYFDEGLVFTVEPGMTVLE